MGWEKKENEAAWHHNNITMNTHYNSARHLIIVCINGKKSRLRFTSKTKISGAVTLKVV